MKDSLRIPLEDNSRLIFGTSSCFLVKVPNGTEMNPPEVNG